MKKRVLLVVVVAAMGLLPNTAARADDSVRLSASSSLIGEHLRMEIRVLAPADATVELTPGTPSWAGLELVGVDEITRVAHSDGVVWFISARVAPFLPGAVEFSPSLAIVQGAEATQIELPPVAISVLPSLAPDAELVLSPLPPPVAIEGAESPFLRPALVGGGLSLCALVALLIWLAGRSVVQRLSQRGTGVPTPAGLPSLDGAERLLDSDPVGAYRLMSAVVKTEMARRYGVRATALTSSELRRKLEAEGDRWQARLVGGLLEECDSVIYAGYRPAAERRQHDLTMAREIVEVAG